MCNEIELNEQYSMILTLADRLSESDPYFANTIRDRVSQKKASPFMELRGFTNRLIIDRNREVAK